MSRTSEVKEFYAHMLDELNQHLIGEKLETFKTNVATIHDVPPKPLSTDRASGIIEHLKNKGIITFIPDGKRKNVDFDGLLKCLKTGSLGTSLQDIVYNWWVKINKALELPLVEYPTDRSQEPRRSLDMHRQCTEKSDFTDHGRHGGLENHRKTMDNAAAYGYLKNLFVNIIEQGIGLVRCHRDGYKVDRGTAYRVGTKYIMTAYHNFENKIEKLWTFIFQKLQHKYFTELSGKWSGISKALDVKKVGVYVDDPKEIMEVLVWEGIWYDGYRNVLELMKAIEPLIGPSNTVDLEKDVKEFFMDKCDIRFSYTEEHFASQQGKGDNSEHKEFVFQCNIPFGSRKHDVLILELTSIKPDQVQNYPSRFKLKYHDHDTDLKTADRIHIFGHPDGKVLQADLHCHLLTKDNVETIDKKKVDFWTKFTSGILKESDIEKGYDGFKTDVDQRLFHVSQSTAHGASGAPCLIVEDTVPVVLVMLLGGYPKFFYNALSLEQQESADLDPQYLIEAGIPMSKVSKLLKEKNLIDLHEDIFKSEVDENTIGTNKQSIR